MAISKGIMRITSSTRRASCRGIGLICSARKLFARDCPGILKQRLRSNSAPVALTVVKSEYILMRLPAGQEYSWNPPVRGDTRRFKISIYLSEKEYRLEIVCN